MSSVRKTMLRAAGFDVEVTRKQQKHMYVRLKPCAGVPMRRAARLTLAFEYA